MTTAVPIEIDEALGHFQRIEKEMLENSTYLYSVHTAAIVTAYLLGRGHTPLNVPEGDKIIVGIIPKEA